MYFSKHKVQERLVHTNEGKTIKNVTIKNKNIGPNKAECTINNKIQVIKMGWNLKQWNYYF